jgi:hypothetical protein
MTVNRATLGQPHDRWLRDLLGADIPGEERATCGSCAMCKQPEAASPGAIAFSSRTKCCTYWPVLHNYIVGGILNDARPETCDGQTRVRAMLHRDWAMPLGVGVAASYRAIYSTTHQWAFGRSALLSCPFLSDGSEARCTIWHHRESVCASFYCKTMRRAVGESFWSAVRSLFAVVERRVALWCALELQIAPAGLLTEPRPARVFAAEQLRTESLDGDSPSHRVGIWGRWDDRREEFYSRCSALAGQLEWSDVCRLAPVEMRAQANALQSAFDALVKPRVPDRVARGAISVVTIVDRSALVSSYRDTDPQWLDIDVIRSLKHFQGQRTEEAVDSAAREDGVDFTRDLLQRLCDARVLVETETTEGIGTTNLRRSDSGVSSDS